MPKSHLPTWLRSYVTSAQVGIIEAEVQKAELKTSGEIVPMIVHRSSVTGHVPFILFLIVTALFLTLQLWTHHWSGFVGYALLSVMSLFAQRSDFLCRILTPADDSTSLVEQRAVREFYQHRLHRTERSTGILLMLSVMEHRAVVLGDEPIAKKLDPEKWNEIVKMMIDGIKKNQTMEGLRDAIAHCGQLLEQHFPIEAKTDRNELSNQLIIKE